MRKFSLTAITIFSIMLSPAQGIYQLWGLKHLGGADELGSFFSTDASGNNFNVRNQIPAKYEGSYPKYSTPIEYNGKFYGITGSGGKFDRGVIFEWDAAAGIYKKKIDFDGTTGGVPTGTLAFFGNKFYGITSGSNSDAAVIFEWDPGTNIYTRMVDFINTDGAAPIGNLVLMGSKFYGMTSKGGAYSAGEIFEWDPVTNIYIKKVDFGALEINGYSPCGNLVPVNGKFYGMTSYGGSNGNSGVIFEWDPATNVYDVKLSFDNNGYRPVGSLSFFGNKFYGFTSLGGTNNLGIFFEWDSVNNSYTTKVDLTTNGGNNFSGSLTAGEGKLYGMMSNGGSLNTGIIFEWDTATNILKKKLDLDDSSGNFPSGSLLWSGGKFYGMMDFGGSTGKGVLFEWDAKTNLYKKKIEFEKREGGVYPTRSLTYYNGKLYGMTSQGGKNAKGVIFEIDPATDLYTKRFDLDDVGGNMPLGNLTLQGGKFYGMTKYGGSGSGIIFEWDPSTGVCTGKVDFKTSGSFHGFAPDGGLSPFNGKFYGMTSLGGVNDVGIIFEWDPATNVYNKKIDFDELNGSQPLGNLSLYNGKFYGMTFGGGVNTLGGVIFEWDPTTNIYTKKIDFDGLNGYQPFGSLTLYNGKFYGTTNGGGVNSSGVLFEWDPATNIFTKKVTFGGSGVDWYIDGFYPFGSLTLSGNKFYGVTAGGGIYRFGVIFEWDPATNIYIKKEDLTDKETGGFELSQDLTLAPAPLAARLANSCVSFPQVTIDSNNNNRWVSIIDTLGNAVAEINANGNNLGFINSYMYVNGGPVREDGAKRLYLDMNLTITPEVQPMSPVDIRVYIKNSEYASLKNAVNSDGEPSGISSINDIAIFKNQDNNCLPASQSIANSVSTTAMPWQNDHVLSASINSFSSFYFAKNFQVLPLTLLEFSGRLFNKNVLLNWKTINQQHVAQFEIERSLNGRNYVVVGTLVAVSTEGSHNYYFTDTKTSSFGKGIIYYRLKLKDNDGRFTYSRIVPIYVENTDVCLLFPNPVVEEVNLTIALNKPQQVTARLIDNTGRTVKRLQWNLPEGSTSMSINCCTMAKGMYYLELIGATINEHKQFSKQ